MKINRPPTFIELDKALQEQEKPISQQCQFT